ncbi:MAG: hypothetical protein WBZ51_05755, partial [Xanthobacteraceae bacterium]
MPLTLRPTGLSSPAYRDWLDYVIVADGPVAEALARLPTRSCIIDGEAVACGNDGIACFELIRRGTPSIFTLCSAVGSSGA